VELAPTLLPARLDLRDRGVGEGGGDALRRRAEGGELDRGGVLALLETLRRQGDEPCPQLLRRLARDGDRRADQRKACFSFARKPSSRW
jgi:hypothetical protein